MEKGIEFTMDSLFEYGIVRFDEMSILAEAVSKEQKEKGQREIVKQTIDPFFRVRDYLRKKWDKPKTKKEYIQKAKEYERFNIILKIMKDCKSEKSAEDYVFNITGDKSPLISIKGSFTGVLQNEYGIPYLIISPELDKYTNGLEFSNLDKKEIRNNIRKFVLYHEYGHLYEFLKDFVETGKASITDTLTARPEEVIDSEGKANAYAIDNMYRKDRRELLKNSKPDTEDIRAKRYYDGLVKHSKTYDKTKKSIDKENSRFNY